MLDFKNELEKIIIDYFIKYNVNPHPANDGKIITFDPINQIHYTNSIVSSSNLNIAISKNLITEIQYNKTLEIIKIFQNNKIPFTWCVVSNSKILKEKDFFLKNGFIYSETDIAMIVDLKQFQEEITLNEKEKIIQVETLEDVEKFRDIIRKAFSLNLIDLQKYYGLYELRKTQKINYQVYLTVDNIPVSTGQFYYQNSLVIIDDIATSPSFQNQGLAKKMLHHLLNTAQKMGYEKAVLIATAKGLSLYKKLGFQTLDLFFHVYEINY